MPINNHPAFAHPVPISRSQSQSLCSPPALVTSQPLTAPVSVCALSESLVHPPVRAAASRESPSERASERNEPTLLHLPNLLSPLHQHFTHSQTVAQCQQVHFPSPFTPFSLASLPSPPRRLCCSDPLYKAAFVVSFPFPLPCLLHHHPPDSPWHALFFTLAPGTSPLGPDFLTPRRTQHCPNRHSRPSRWTSSVAPYLHFACTNLEASLDFFPAAFTRSPSSYLITP